MIDFNIRRCRFVEDVVHTDTNKADLTNVDIIIDNVITVKTIIHILRDNVHGINVLDGLLGNGLVLFLCCKFDKKTCSSKFIL